MFNLCAIYEVSHQIQCMPEAVGRLKGTESMSIEEVSVEWFAQLFHHYHQALSDVSGNAAYQRTCDAWADVPASEKKRLITAARLALLEVEVTPSERQSRRYFAKPGEAEWGC
jgi:hypothetical protein